MSRTRLIIGVLINVATFGGLLFAPAGTVAWWRAWAFLGVVLVGAVASTVALSRANTGVLEERFKPPVQKGQPLADKILVVLFIAGFVGAIGLIPLDVFRFHLMAPPNAVVSSVGLVLFVAGWWIITLSMLENPFAAPVVKLQQERGQTVIATGVYGVVRHPMYAGAVLLLVGMPLWLESIAAAILTIAPFSVLVVRILFEERFLKRQLKGYDAYTRQVRYRLIPFVW